MDALWVWDALIVEHALKTKKTENTPLAGQKRTNDKNINTLVKFFKEQRSKYGSELAYQHIKSIAEKGHFHFVKMDKK